MAVVYFCPHCKRTIRAQDPPSTHIPLKTCLICGKHYIDPFCSEPALRKYSPLPVWNHLLSSFSSGIISSFLLTLLATTIVDAASTRWLIFGLGACIVFSLSLLHRMLSRQKSEKVRLETWQESDRRLRDPKYAITLKLYGYHVPAQYLPSGYDEQKNSLSLPGITVSDSFGKKKNPPPKNPNGPMDY